MGNHNEFVLLFEQARAGSKPAFDELVKRYSDHVRRVVERILHPRLRARFDTVDFLQSIWKTVFSRIAELPEMDSPARLIGYLRSVARNKVIDVHRRCLTSQKGNVRKERPLKANSFPAAASPRQLAPRPSEIAVAREEWQRLAVGLSPQERRILELRASGETQNQIARVLDVDVRTVRRVLARLAQRTETRGNDQAT